MPRRSHFRFFATVVLVGLGTAAWLWTGVSACGQSPTTETVRVSKTYNDAPFDYRIRPLAERANFRVYRLTYPSPVVTSVEQNNTVPADYYVPKDLRPGVKYPAVICMHILDGNEPLTELMCSALASRGVPAIAFKLPYYGPRGLPEGPEAMAKKPAMFFGAIEQAGEDVRRTVDVLASRPEVNPERIGITGISLGGIVAATASGGEPRLYRAGLILAGGDLQQIIHHARETRPLSEMIGRLPPAERAALDAKLAEVDPLHFASNLRRKAEDGRVLMINAAEDEVIPRVCTEKLAKALGIADRVVWLKGLGHYTAMAELPRALRTTTDFFAQDIPVDVAARPRTPVVEPSALQRMVSVLHQAVTMLAVEPSPGHCHYAELDASVSWAGSRPIEAHVRLVRGDQGKFSLQCRLPGIGETSMGQNEFPWLVAGQEQKRVLVGTKKLDGDGRSDAEATAPAGGATTASKRDAMSYVEPRHLARLGMAAGMIGGIAMAPEVLLQWIVVADEKDGGSRVIRITAKDHEKIPGEIRLTFQADGKTPEAARFSIAGVRGEIHFRGWQTNTVATAALVDPPADLPREEVQAADLHRVFGAMLNFGLSRLDGGEGEPSSGGPLPALAVVASDPAGHGLLCRGQGKWILMVAGTPREMGAAQGFLLRNSARNLCERVVYLVGGADSIHSGHWFLDRMAEVERRTSPHIPPRFIEECDAMAVALGISQRDARYANLFPERFHCSGVALRGKATAGGRVLHARVLDYMTEIGLQEDAVVQVFMPKGLNAWMSHGYAGFIGTVTAMNEKGLAVGEMGGRGEGDWDGMPMTLMLRDVMERAATVAEALQIIEKTPRTCEYFYVLSDRTGALAALHCRPREMTVLKPGQQHPRLPFVPEDVVFISGDDRAKLLSSRIQENYGRIDAAKLIEIIRRPVAMSANLHNAVFAPETLEMWCADAGRSTPACDEPYARFNLRALLDFYARQKAKMDSEGTKGRGVPAGRQ